MNKMYCTAMTLAIICLFTACKTKIEDRKESAIEVKTERIVKSEAEGVQGFSGTVEESSGSILSFSTAGTISNIFVEQGEMVKKGALLAQVDETTLKNVYQSAQAAKNQAEDAYKRMKLLHDNNSLPEIQWIEVQSKLKQAVAAEQIAKKSLSDSKLYAPYSGFISEKTAEVGQNIMPGLQVFKIVKIDNVKVKISVPENEIGKIKNGDNVRIYLSVLGDKLVEGTVFEKGVAANPLSRSYEVKVLVKNTNHEILPGMVCDVYINSKDEEVAIILPSRKITIDENNKAFVWLNIDGKATKRVLDLGEQTAKGVIIKKGLNEGEEIIVEGSQKISEGMAITTKKE